MLLCSTAALAVYWRRYTFLNWRAFNKEKEREVVRRLESVSQALCSLLLLGTPEALNAGGSLCTRAELRSVFAWSEACCCLVSKQE